MCNSLNALSNAYCNYEFANPFDFSYVHIGLLFKSGSCVVWSIVLSHHFDKFLPNARQLFGIMQNKWYMDFDVMKKKTNSKWSQNATVAVAVVAITNTITLRAYLAYASDRIGSHKLTPQFKFVLACINLTMFQISFTLIEHYKAHVYECGTQKYSCWRDNSLYFSQWSNCQNCGIDKQKKIELLYPKKDQAFRA